MNANWENTYYLQILVFSLALALIWYCIIALIRWKKFFEASSLWRGNRSERALIRELIKLGNQPKSIFHDLYLPKPKGKYSQLDAILITEQGLVVFEVKKYKGWIFGNAYHPKWTQVLAYGKRKYRFPNPIQQNEGHLKVLRQQSLQLAELPIFSVVIFYGKCELKEIDFVPENTYVAKAHHLKKVLKQIAKSNPKADYHNLEEIIQILSQATHRGRILDVQEDHVQAVKDQLGHERVFK